MQILRYPLSLFLIAISVIACRQQVSNSELFKSAPVTPVNSSTSGVEGPAVDKAGNVYYVNYEHEGTIGQLTPDGKSNVFIELPEGSVGNGIRFDSQGNMLIADYTKHNILKVDMESRKLTIFAHEPAMSQPNDIAVDRNDHIFASDPDWNRGTGRIWRIDNDGKVSLLDSLGTANGIDVSPDGKNLYVNASGKVFAYNLSAGGNISEKRVITEFSDFEMDGMRFDIKGNLYIARYGKGTVVKISPEGKIIQEIILVGKKPTNIAFGGKDGCTAYVTLQDQGNLESFRIDFPGFEWEMQKRVKTK